MTREEILKRIEFLELSLNQSMANHNALAGRLSEAKFQLEEFDKKESEPMESES